MDTGSLVAWIALAVTVVGMGAAWVIRFGKVEAAAETAKTALARAEAVEATLAAFKTEVARNYATASMVAAVETGVSTAINRLTDRLDRVLELRPATTPRNRPARD